MKLTLKEIALESGVSAATVSRVLNGYKGVSAEKREQIRRVLERLKDAPVGRGRGRIAAAAIGVMILPDCRQDTNVLMRKLSVAVERLPRRWSLVLLRRNIQPLELDARRRRGELSGLLIAGHTEPDEFAGVLANIPHVWLNSHRTSTGEIRALGGNELAGRLAARHLIAKSCKRFACVDFPSANPGVQARNDGFAFELFSRSLKCRRVRLALPKPMECCPLAPISAGLEQVFRCGEWPECDGLFSPEDRVTALLHRVLRQYKRKLPVIVSCDYMPEYLAGLYPRPASIDLCPERHGELAITELINRIEKGGDFLDDISIIVTPKLEAGE